MSSELAVIQVGMGPLGQMMTPRIVERSDVRLVGAVDIDPEKIGVDAGTVCGLNPLGVEIVDNLEAALGDTRPDVAVVTTVSSIDAIRPVLKTITSAGVNVVTTCEELSYPWIANPKASAAVDAAARAGAASVLGTGINPGFLMDFLPSAASAVCRSVQTVQIERTQDASARRLPFIQKIGAGIDLEEFRKLADLGKIRHVGLTESMHMVAAALGWTLSRTEDIVEPVVAERSISGDGWTVSPGQAAGVNQTGRGFVGTLEVLTLRFVAAVGHENPGERIHIQGVPEFDVHIPGGINGDIATCSVVANAIPVVAAAAPGLRTMIDIAPVTCKN